MSNLEIAKITITVMEKLLNDVCQQENSSRPITVSVQKPFNKIWDRCDCTSVCFKLASKTQNSSNLFHDEVQSGRFKQTIQKKYGSIISMDIHHSWNKKYKTSHHLCDKVVVKFPNRSIWLKVLAGGTANYKTKNEKQQPLTIQLKPVENHEPNCEYRPVKTEQGRTLDKRIYTQI